jgi:hypothetical protein
LLITPIERRAKRAKRGAVCNRVSLSLKHLSHT